MLRSTMPEQNAERAKQAANYGMDWMRQLMEESLNQTRAIFDGFLTTARKTADSFDQQAAEVRERSMSMATDTLSNSMDFAHRALKVRQPQDLLQLQTEFVSRQAQVVAENSKMLGKPLREERPRWESSHPRAWRKPLADRKPRKARGPIAGTTSVMHLHWLTRGAHATHSSRGVEPRGALLIALTIVTVEPRLAQSGSLLGPFPLQRRSPSSLFALGVRGLIISIGKGDRA